MANKLLERIAELKNSIAKTKMTDADVKYMENANDVEHTTNTGYGKELVPVDVLSNNVYNAVFEGSNFLNKFPGYHGANMGTSEKVPAIGDVGFAVGNTEWTTGAGAIAQ